MQTARARRAAAPWPAMSSRRACRARPRATWCLDHLRLSRRRCRPAAGRRSSSSRQRRRGRPHVLPPAADRADSFWLILKAFWINVYIFCVAEVLVLVWALVVAIARLLPGPAGPADPHDRHVYTDVFRGLPAIIIIYLVGFGLPLDRPAVRSKDLPHGCVRDPGADADLRRLRRRGLPRGHREHPLEPDRGRPLARPLLHADAALRRRAAGGAAHHPAAAQRLHRPAEGHGAGRTSSASIDAFNQAKIIASNSLQPVAGDDGRASSSSSSRSRRRASSTT